MFSVSVCVSEPAVPPFEMLHIQYPIILEAHLSRSLSALKALRCYGKNLGFIAGKWRVPHTNHTNGDAPHKWVRKRSDAMSKGSLGRNIQGVGPWQPRDVPLGVLWEVVTEAIYNYSKQVFNLFHCIEFTYLILQASTLRTQINNK
jgi:hypothetical protein